MNFSTFQQSFEQETPPPSLSSALQALWYDAQGNWEKAHDLAQNIENANGAWIHAYLHRKEGDLPNAGYWYRRAGQSQPSLSLEDEWEQITRHLLGDKAK